MIFPSKHPLRGFPLGDQTTNHQPGNSKWKGENRAWQINTEITQIDTNG